jgi:hypothetical protein
MGRSRAIQLDCSYSSLNDQDDSARASGCNSAGITHNFFTPSTCRSTRPAFLSRKRYEAANQRRRHKIPLHKSITRLFTQQMRKKRNTGPDIVAFQRIFFDRGAYTAVIASGNRGCRHLSRIVSNIDQHAHAMSSKRKDPCNLSINHLPEFARSTTNQISESANPNHTFCTSSVQEVPSLHQPASIYPKYNP